AAAAARRRRPRRGLGPDEILAAGPGLHLADRDAERIWTKAQHPAEPLEGSERRGCVVAHAVEAVCEGQVRGRTPPPLPAKPRGLERGAERLRREVEEMLAGLVVVPEPSEKARLQAADIGCDQMDATTRAA